MGDQEIRMGESRFQYRVWNPEAKKFVPPEMFVVGSLGTVWTRTGPAWLRTPCYNRPAPPSCQLLQFTGRRDARDRKIFEGDIIRHTESPEWKGEVIWADKRAGFEVRWLGLMRAQPKTPLPWALFHINLEYFAVVGNIYENPELME